MNTLTSLTPEDLEKSFHTACKKGNAEQLQRILQYCFRTASRKNALFQWIQKSDTAALFQAIQSKSPQTVDLLLELDPEKLLKKRNSSNQTPLIYAAQMGHPEMVQAILNHHPDTRERAHGYTALMTAAAQGNTPVVDTLIQYDTAQKHLFIEQIQNQIDALGIATFNRHIETIQLLLSHQVDPNEPDKNGSVPLLSAAMTGYPELVNLFLQHHPKQQTKNQALLDVVEYGNRAYQRQQRDPNPAALKNAVAAQNQIIRTLIEHGANPLAQNDNGDTALMTAIMHENTEAITSLLPHQTEQQFQIPNKQNQTAWTLAFENKTITQLLQETLRRDHPEIPCPRPKLSEKYPRLGMLAQEAITLAQKAIKKLTPDKDNL